MRPVLLALLILVVAVPAATAAPKLQVGISDQSAAVFDDPQFQAQRLRYARLVVPWNIGLKPAEQGSVRAWIANAQARRIQPHIAFNVERFDRALRLKPPSRRQYRRAVRAFRRQFPAVRVFTPWNEANHFFQPTARRPDLAAAYYGIVRAACRSCTVLGADVLDGPGVERWLATFRRRVKGKPRLWGVHNYQDANNFRSFRTSYTRKFTRLLPGRLWSTESGGIVRFQTDTGRVARPYSPARADRALRHLFRLLRQRTVRKRYTRIYLYNWFGTSDGRRSVNRWDSGLIGLDGRPRPALLSLRTILRRLGHRVGPLPG